MRPIVKNILIIVFFGVITLLPFLISGQITKTNECCEIKATFSLDLVDNFDSHLKTTKFKSTCFVGRGGGYCEKFGNTDHLLPLSNIGAMPECPCVGTCSNGGVYIYEQWGLVCMLNSVFTVTNWIFYILTLIVIIMFIWGGFTYVISAGEPEKAGKGKKVITYAIIGLAIALVSRAIPSMVRFIVGM